MRNYVTSGGLLQDGDELGQLYSQGKLQRDAQLEMAMPFVPQNQQELVMMQRTMIPAGQNEQGQPQFTSPEKAIYDQNKIQMQQLQGKAGEDFDRKVSNPLFKLGDFAADLARNTIGAPINFLTDGVGFQMDPSKSAVEGYKKRLQDLDQLQELNAKSFYGGRDARAMAFENAVTDRNNSIAANRTSDPSLKTSGTPRLNNNEEFVQMYEDGRSKVITDVNGNPVKAMDSSAVMMVNGLPVRWNKVTQELEMVGDHEAFMQQAQNQLDQKIFIERRNKFDNARPKLNKALDSADTKTTLLKKKVNEARDLIRQYGGRATGWGGLLAGLPEDISTELAGIISTLQATVAFSTLQDMRANSVSGGALGNVSDTEIKLLYESLGTLNNLTNADQLLNTFNDIEYNADRAVSGLRRAFNDERNEYYSDPEKDDYLGDYYSRDYFKNSPTIGSPEFQQLPKLDDETRKILEELGVEPE